MGVLSMNEQRPLLEVRFDGEAIGPGEIPVSHLLRFLASLNKALQRIGRVLQGQAESRQRGRLPRSIGGEVEFNLISLEEGSPAAVLGFERRQMAPGLPDLDLGLEVLDKAVNGLREVQEDDDKALPTGFDPGVLMAWREAGTVFGQGIERIEFTLNRREEVTRASFTPKGLMRIRQRISGPQVNVRTIEGRLLMADFKEHGTRCRVHSSVGDPILCLFDEAQKDEVLENILRYVRIAGESKEDPVSGKIASIKIHDIERLEDQRNDAQDLLPLGTPVSRSFWETPTLEELARSQNVQPMADVRSLFGTWPGEKDDGFEAAIDELRYRDTRSGNRS